MNDSTIQETHILECNRLHSIEYKSDNNENQATWQNVVGALDVKKGDTVELHSAFIGERGCSTLNAIEFKGSKISQDKHTITYTQIKKSELRDTRIYIDNPFAKWEVSTITEDVDQIDNKANIVIGFYKNSNLENTMFLPRKFAYKSADIPNSYAAVDDASYGMCFTPLTETYITYDYGKGVYNSATNTNTFVKPLSDNSRFTCLIRQGVNYVNAVAGAEFQDNYKDPALCDYDYYREKIELNVDKGYNGADDIATVLTQQLTATKRQDTFYSDPDYAASLTYETQTYKPMLCANSLFTDTIRTAWEAGTINADTIRYNNAYQFIWCKRPDFFLGGRNLNDRGGFQLVNEITKQAGDRTTNAPLVLNLEWNITNLNKLNDYFKIQKNNWNDFFWNNQLYYMNVKDGEITTPYARFLHMNIKKNASMSDPAVLGDDSYNSNATLTDCLQSGPVFFYFDETYEDIQTSGYHTDKLFYGFATRTTVLGVEYITLHPNVATPVSGAPIGIPNSFIPDATLEIGRRIGHDYHFNAYGNLCMSIFSGYLNTDQSGKFSPGIKTPGGVSVALSNTYDHIYCGASQPLISYENDHFNISLLHNPENIGQIDFTVGSTLAGAQKITDTASDSCYRLNKRVPNVQYCPDAKPYEKETNITNGKVFQININAVPYKIFDAHGGIFIEDFGYNKLDHKNGLWGIMGFSYDQFNAPLTSNNLRNSRITSDNIYNLQFPTTNAVIVSSSAKTYTLNPYNAGFFTNQLPTPYLDSANPLYPAIVITPAESIKLISENLPRKMLKPYYTIRSSIIPYLNYTGAKDSNTLLPVIGVVNKINGDGDFYFETSNNMSFIANKNFTVNDIYTSIHDPDGTFATVSLDSCVLIKVIKNVEMVDAVQQILAEDEAEQSKKKK